jgi:YD repeat-containing protein
LESENYLNSKGENVNIQYAYSASFPSKPIHIEQKVNGRIISGEKFIFNEFAQPTRISNYYDGIGYIKTKEIVYSTFDNISKPIQQIDYGVGNNQNSITSLTWAYNYSFPIINAQNASHFDLNNAVSNASIGNYSNLDDFLIGVGDFFYENGSFNNANKEAFALFVNEVQEALPEALVTLYTYCPLKGVTSQTDPNGKTIYYRYDDFGRLSNIKDNEGNILKSYDYNYAQ